MRLIRRAIERGLHRAGYALQPLDLVEREAPEVSSEDLEVMRKVHRFTMTSPRRVAALCDAVRHVVREDIPGAVVECGVWRGGSMMAAALVLLQEGRDDRNLYLFDTYAGMPEPRPEDVYRTGKAATEVYTSRLSEEGTSTWAKVLEDEVVENLATTGYPAARVHLIKGLVEETIPDEAPEQIALLRLDTDFYASTRHELDHLWARVSRGGVIILDDYGSWSGARKATDEFLEATPTPVYLHRLDRAGRLIVKQ